MTLVTTLWSRRWFWQASEGRLPLLAAPGNAAGLVFDDDAGGRQFVANLIRRGKLLCRLCRLALVQLLLDLHLRHARTIVGTMEPVRRAEQTQDLSELSQFS